MALSRLRCRWEDFSGGLDQRVDVESLPANATQDALNCDLTAGVLSLAAGYDRYCAKGLPDCRTLMAWHGLSPADRILVAATDHDVLRWNGQDWVSIRGNLTISNGAFGYLNYQENDDQILIMGNGVDPVYIWRGSGNLERLTPASASQQAPKGSCLALHYERVWMTGVADAPQTLFYSDDLDPQGWVYASYAAGEISLPTWDGDGIIGLATLLDDVVVFKRHSIFRIVGTYPDEYRKTQVYATEGAIARHTICQYHDRAFFLSRDGLMVYDGMRAAPLLEGRLRDVWRRMNETVMDKANACVCAGTLYLALPLDGSAVNSHLITFDLATGAFMLRDIEARSLLPDDGGLLFINHEGMVCQLKRGQARAVGRMQRMHWVTPETTLGQPDAVKTLRQLYLTGWGGGLSVEVRCDGGVARHLVFLPGQRGTVRLPVYLRGVGFSVRLSNVSGSCPHLCGLQLTGDLET